MNQLRITLLVGIAISATQVCASESANEVDRAVHWVRTAAEFQALSMQGFQAAHEDLDKFIADKNWSALPQQRNAAGLPPAIITDVDETMVSNVEFQATFEPPFANYKLDDWNSANAAEPLPGAVEFISRAREAGVTIFYVTNRPCETKPGVEDTCPQKAVTIQDLREAGFPVNEDKVMLSHQQPGWDREKSVRRNHIAKTHRVIMLFGDDLGDFIDCTRKKPLTPCTQAANIAGRAAKTQKMQDYWGDGWYIFPNPMHGSWTTVE